MTEINSFPGPGLVSATDEDHSIFLLTGNVGLTLKDNSGSLVFMTAANTEVGLILDATDKNETILDVTRNSSPTVSLQTGGVSQVNTILGYGNDPNATVDIMAQDLASITHTPFGTTLMTAAGGKVAIIGGNYGITAQFGTGLGSTLVIGNLNDHTAIPVAR